MYLDPEEAAEVVNKSHAPDGPTLEEAKEDVDGYSGDWKGECGGVGNIELQIQATGGVSTSSATTGRQSIDDVLIVDGNIDVDDTPRDEDEETHDYSQLEERVTFGPHIREEKLALEPDVCKGGRSPSADKASFFSLLTCTILFLCVDIRLVLGVKVHHERIVVFLAKQRSEDSENNHTHNQHTPDNK